jgi:hypothetical protein
MKRRRRSKRKAEETNEGLLQYMTDCCYHNGVASDQPTTT